jgi:IclR family transcriptional regulator, acetate operon repressor
MMGMQLPTPITWRAQILVHGRKTPKPRTASLKARPPEGSRSTASRVLELLHFVARSPRPMKLEEISAATGIPKPTALRILQTLTETNALLRDAGPKSYSPGTRLTNLAISALVNSPLRAARHLILKNLVDQIGETCNFTTLDGSEVTYIDRVECRWPLRLQLQPGSRVPLHCTSSGKIYLSEMSARQRRSILRVPLKRFTPRTIVDPKALEVELRQIRKRQYSTDNEGFLTGLISVAVPVMDRTQRVFATVAVHAPSARLSLRDAQTYIPLLRAAAERLAQLY